MKFRTGHILVLALVLMPFAAGACSMLKGKETGERAVVRFHEQFNSGQYADIYRQTDEGFRKATNESDMLALLGAVRRKLGSVKNTNQVNSKVDITYARTVVMLSYETEFTDGRATEHFVYYVSGGSARLYRYDIMSSLLVTR